MCQIGRAAAEAGGRLEICVLRQNARQAAAAAAANNSDFVRVVRICLCGTGAFGHHRMWNGRVLRRIIVIPRLNQYEVSNKGVELIFEIIRGEEIPRVREERGQSALTLPLLTSPEEKKK